MMVCEASGRFWSANLGGTAGVYLFITLVPYNRRGQEFFILFEKGATIMSKHVPYRIYLPEERIPRQWYNLRADMKEQPAPFLNPGTMQPLKLEELYPIFCEELAQQEFDSTNRYIDIPRPSVPLRSSVPIIWRKSWARPRKSTVNLKATTPPAAISSIPPSRRPIMPKSRAFKASLRRRGPASGARRSPWRAHISTFR